MQPAPVDDLASGDRELGRAEGSAYLPAWIHDYRLWLTLVAVLAISAASLPFLPSAHKHIESESRHVATHVRGLTLSRDGKLIAYIAALAGELPHAWVRLTSGSKPIRVTDGPDPGHDA